MVQEVDDLSEAGPDAADSGIISWTVVQAIVASLTCRLKREPQTPTLVEDSVGGPESHQTHHL